MANKHDSCVTEWCFDKRFRGGAIVGSDVTGTAEGRRGDPPGLASVSHEMSSLRCVQPVCETSAKTTRHLIIQLADGRRRILYGDFSVDPGNGGCESKTNDEKLGAVWAVKTGESRHSDRDIQIRKLFQTWLKMES